MGPGHRHQVGDPLTGPVAGITNVALPDGPTPLLTGSYDYPVRLWHPDWPGEPTELGSHASTVAAVAVDPQGRWVVTGGWDQRVRLWHPTGPVSHSWRSTRT